MYRPAQFKEDRIEVLHALIRDAPFATLVTLGGEGLIASHIPIELDPEPAPYGTLLGHVARANPQWRDIDAGQDALVIFAGPHAYVSPSWYPSKHEDGRVVPTWNYAVVHAYGPLRTFDDRDRLLALVRALTDRQESRLAEPWSVDDAPEDFVGRMLKGIVGLEIPITRLEGKWKNSQNRSPEDQAGARDGLRATGHADAAALADLIDAGLDD